MVRLTKEQIEQKHGERISQIWKEVQHELKCEGIEIGKLVEGRYGGDYRVTRMKPVFYNHAEHPAFHVEIYGVKLLASGEFGTHVHCVIVE